MPKEEWGVKRVCPTTGKRFYDLNKNPVVSPYTGEVVPLDDGPKSRVAIQEEKKSKPEKKDAEVIDEGDVLEEEDSDVDLGDDVLEEDDEDSVSLDDIADVGSDDDET
ncbi:MAG TPA: TIGR02300 family protein [Paracoccaceae bacterium]|nr:TIGR02300 family protein [Paracoccaceae bacterium]